MKEPGYTVMVHKDGALDSRQWHVPRWGVRLAAGALAVSGLALLLAVVFYGPIFRAAGRTPFLERRIAGLEGENRRVVELAQRLDEAEARYAQLRGMLGGDVALPEHRPADVGVRPVAEERLYVAPPLLARGPGDSAAAGAEGPSVPHRWPLGVPSFRTRGMAQGDPSVETHGGLDLAVPIGSVVRAAGGGVVKEAGTDSAFGMYVLVEHPEAYETMYGHLSRVLVERGAQIRAGQAIGLSGNTGRSTAPHLHFEVRRAGRMVDPLTLVREGS